MRSMTSFLAVLVLLGVAVSCAQKESPAPGRARAQSIGDQKIEPTADKTNEQGTAGSVQPTSVGGGPVKAEGAVRRMSAFYRGLKSFEVRSEQETHIEAQGRNQTMTVKSNVVFERPNRLAIRSADGMMGLTIVSDGKTLYTVVGMLKRYTKQNAPQSLGELADNPIFGAGMGGPRNLLFPLLTDDPYKAFVEGVDESQDLGAADVDGKPARHLRFIQQQFDWEAWIGSGEQPFLLQVSLDMSKMLKKFGGAAFGGGSAKFTVVQRFLDWKTDVTPNPDAFAYTPPKNLKETKSLFGGSEEAAEAEELSPLLGKAAPPIDLKRLDGGRLKLADHAGKDVVLLDMWATWCGPCREEMPHVAEIAKEYKSRGGACFAVKQGESKKAIDDFLKKEKIEFPIVLDEDHAVSDAYGADSIPMVVLIDNKGVVQSVHVGYSPQIKTALRKDLDAILAGKNLAAEALALLEAKKARRKASAASGGLDRVWSTEGRYSSAVYDANSKNLFALEARGQCA